MDEAARAAVAKKACQDALAQKKQAETNALMRDIDERVKKQMNFSDEEIMAMDLLNISPARIIELRMKTKEEKERCEFFDKHNIEDIYVNEATEEIIIVEKIGKEERLLFYPLRSV